MRTDGRKEESIVCPAPASSKIFETVRRTARCCCLLSSFLSWWLGFFCCDGRQNSNGATLSSTGLRVSLTEIAASHPSSTHSNMSNPNEVAGAFCNHFYQTFSTNVDALAGLYVSRLWWVSRATLNPHHSHSCFFFPALFTESNVYADI